MAKPTKPAWTRDQVASRILAGENLIIYHNELLKIPNSWLDIHPAGPLPILHFVGRDATDEIDVFHGEDTKKRIMKYSIGPVEVGKDGWEPLLPPIASGWVRRVGKDGEMAWFKEAVELTSHEKAEALCSPSGQVLLVESDCNLVQQAAPTLSAITPPQSSLCPEVQARHIKAYRALHQRILDAGLFETPYLTGYGPEVLRYTLLAGSAAYLFSKGWIIPSAVCLGLFWQQLVFVAHDLGHMGVTHNWEIDRLISIFVADFLGGLSIGWWVDSHNVHHLVTNSIVHDPDIQHLPFFAISPEFFKSLWSSYYKRSMPFDRFAEIVISIQHKLFYIVLSLARFNLYALSYTHLFWRGVNYRKRAKGGHWAFWLEVVGLAVFWCWFGGLLRACGNFKTGFLYLLISHVFASPVHVQIVLSHFSMSTDNPGPVESFVDRGLRTTTDVICDPSIEFVHGGLHLQVTHHLFPRLPRHNLRKASLMVKEFAREQGLVYAEFGFVEGNGEVVGVLKGVANQLKIMKTVADGEIQERMQSVTKGKN